MYGTATYMSNASVPTHLMSILPNSSARHMQISFSIILVLVVFGILRSGCSLVLFFITLLTMGATSSMLFYQQTR